jgi:MFS family permease
MTHMLAHVFRRVHSALFPLIRGEFNLSLRQLGIIAAVPSLCAVLISIPTGLLTDRFGSKRMIIVSQCMVLLGGIIASRTLNPLMLIVAFSLISMNSTVYHSSSYSFITNKLFRRRDVPKAIGIQDIGGNFGTAIGPISVGILMGLFAFGWRQVYFFWLVPILLGIIGVLSIRSGPAEDLNEYPPVEAMSQPQSNSMFTTSLALFLAFIAIRGLAASMVGVFLPVYLIDEKGLSESLSSLIYGSSALMGMVGAPVGGFLSSRIGEKRWLLTVLSLACVSLSLAVAVPNVIIFVAFYLSYGFCNTLAMSARSALMAKLSPSRRRGLGYSLYFLPGSLMGVMAPLIAANVAEAFGMTSIFFVALAVYFVGLALLTLGVKVPTHVYTYL